MKKGLRYGVSTAIFIGFVIAVQLVYGWATLLAPWQTLAWPSIVIALLLMFVSYWLRAWRFYSYFHEMHPYFPACFRLMLQHNLWNNLLPMRSGEISFPLLMKSYFSVPVVRSVSALAWFRVMDLHTLGIFAIIALCFLVSLPAAAIILLPIWMLLPWGFHCYVRKKRHQLLHLDSRLGRIISAYVMHMPEETSQFFKAWGLTLINWGMKLWVYAWMLKQFSSISIVASIAGVVGGELTSVLPINGVAGAGTYEGGVAAIVILYGYDFKAVFLSAINLHLFILGAACVSGLLSGLLPKKKHCS